MANTTVAIKRRFRKSELSITRNLTVATGVTIPEGSLVSINGSGEAIVAATNARIAGYAIETKTAAEVVQIIYNNVVCIDLPSVAVTAIGTAAYAADNQTATTTPNTAILGPIVEIETDKAWVHLTTRV